MKKRLLLAASLGLIAARRLLDKPATLEGRSVLITGASRGLGLALARECAARGARLAIMARDASELERAAADLWERGARVLVLPGDVTRPEDAEAAVSATVREYGGLDLLVNVAGIIQSGPSANLTLHDYHEVMDTNFFGALHLVTAARGALGRSRGRILNVASVGGKLGVPHLASYCAAKFALVGLGQSLRAELAGEGVTLTTACPGLMQTGSPRNATVKGRKREEYALFATLDNLPLLSQKAGEAARQMLDACLRGDAEPVIGGAARLLVIGQHLAPQLNADLLALGNRLLPKPARDDRGVEGKQVETAITRRNPIKRDAEARLNER